MVSFSPGWNFAPPKNCCDYTLNFSPGAKRKFPWESFLRYENTVNAHARVPFSARAEILFRLHETFSDFQARLAGLKILARSVLTGLGFSARAELRPGLNPSPCNRQFGFQRICFRGRFEISARDEIRHVIRPLKLERVVNKYAPLKIVSKRKAKQLSKSWITRGIRIAIWKKSELYYSGDMVKYKLCTNKILTLSRLSKKILLS